MSFDQSFLRAVTRVLSEEGGYVNDPRDPGGETNFGISKRAYPAVDIKALTPEKATEIYYRDYWLAASCDKLPPNVAGAVFDSAVNQGVGRAVKLLQLAVGVPADGQVGPKTIEGAGKKSALVDFTAQRILHYASLPTFDVYGKGWVKRAIRTAIT